MTTQDESLLHILEIGHETSLRGSGWSLREALARTRYRELRPQFGPADLLPIIARQPSFIEQWVLYSEDKRTSGGWYLLENGEIGRVGDPKARVQYGSQEEAVAEYVVRELDYWVGAGAG